MLTLFYRNKIIIVLLVLTTTIPCYGNGDISSSNCLTLSISTNKTNFQINEDIIYEVSLTNNCGNVIVLPFYVLDPDINHYIDVINQDGRSCCHPEVDVFWIKDNRVIFLMPDYTLSTKINLNHPSNNQESKSNVDQSYYPYTFEEIGIYRIRSTIICTKAFWKDTKFKLKRRKAILWTGKILSNEIEIRVSE